MQADKVTAIHSASQLQFQSGTIESINEQGYRILGQDGHFNATRAFSCIVEPMLADIVLFSIDERLQCHVLSILERPDGEATSLVFPGDVTLNAAQGQMSIYAQQGVNMISEQEINLTSEEYSLVATKALFSIDKLTAMGSILVSKINHVQTIAKSVETVADHWLQKLKNSFRQVEGVDQLKARDSIHTVNNLYSMRSKQAAILAKKDIKIDAERIHMG